MQSIGPIDPAERRRAIAEFARSVEQARERSPQLIDDLRVLLLASDPLDVYSRLIVMDAMRRDALSGAENFGSDAAIEFLGGFITSFAEATILPLIGTEYPDQHVFSIEALLREYANAQLSITFAETAQRGAPTRTDGVVNQLRLENQFDRMLGYPQHIKQVTDRIFDSVDDASKRVLGFRLSLAVEVSDAYSEIFSAKFRRAQDYVNSAFEGVQVPADFDARIQITAGHMMGLTRFGCADVENDMAGMVAAYGGFDRQEVDAVLTSLSTPLGTQPSLARLSDTNRLRNQPILAVSDGRMLWGRPNDFIHSALDWAFGVCQADTGLLRAFDRSRQRVCEELAYEFLARSLPGAGVWAGLTYPDKGQRPDIDAFATAPNAAVAIEAKGGRLTESGRRGAPDRVKKKAGELIDHATQQNARTSTYLLEGGSDFRDSNRRRVKIDRPSVVLSVIATLDRVDPFYSFLPPVDSATEMAWSLTVHDLLMISDTLKSATEVFGYINDRCNRASLGYPIYMTETAALEDWIEGRRGRAVKEGGDSDRRLFSASPEKLNVYFTELDLASSGAARDADASRPRTAIPQEVLEACDHALLTGRDRWHDVAIAICHASDREWATLARSLNRAKSNPGKGGRRSRKRFNQLERGFELSTGVVVAIAQDGSIQLSIRRP